MIRLSIRAFPILAVASATLACGQAPELDVREDGGDASRAERAPMAQPAHDPSAASALPAGHPPTGGMPADHPPIGDAGTDALQLAPVPESAGTGEAALAWTAPAGWVAEPPANTMRRAQYRVPGPGGDGECVVFYFGPGQGGDPMANAERWADQFSGGTEMATRTETVGDVEVLWVERTGTYQAGSMMGMGQGVSKPDWALLGAIAEGPDSNWFFKFTGPKATVDAEREAFGAMIGSLRQGG